jgi:DNA invertase Pin-like site-specific DNA recombinase
MKSLRLDALIRQSQETDEGRSPQQQRDICEGWAEANGAKIVHWHEAIDVSGKTMRRDDVDAALKRIESRQTDGVIVAWLDRFSRAPVPEALGVYEDIQSAGGMVVAADMSGIDPRDPTGEFVLTNMLAVNRMQWRRIAERHAMNRRDAIKEGKAIGGAPFGYVYRDPTRINGLPADSRLLVDESKREIVQELFERKVSGATWTELARFLDTVAPKPDGRKWHRNSARGMIHNRTYLGELRHGEFVNPTAHEPIIGSTLWRRAQPEPGRRTPRGTYLLSGLARCAGCGRTLRGSTLGRGDKRIYTCDGQDCQAKSTVIVPRLDNEVVRQLFERLEAFHLEAVDDREVEHATAAVRRLQEEVQRLAQVIPSHPTAIEAHQEALSAAETRLNHAEDQLSDLTAAISQNGSDFRSLERDWPDLTCEERREIVGAGIDTVLVRRASSRGVKPPVAERILVLFRGEAPDALRARRGPVRNWTWMNDERSLVSTP